jgi:hypothetical protein
MVFPFNARTHVFVPRYFAGVILLERMAGEAV